MTRREDSRATGRWRRAAVAVAIAALGCGPGAEPGQEPPPETVDVAPAISIDVGNDPQAVAPKPSLTGVLPADFPDDLPLYLPASLIDFGGGAAGARSVTLLSPHARTRVAGELERLLAGRGWSVGGGGDARVLRKGSRQVRLEIRDGNPGTIFRFEY